MHIKFFLKIWLLSANFEKFVSINHKCDQSLLIDWCDWSLFWFTYMNFSKLPNNNQIFRLTLFAFFITAVKFQLELLIASNVLFITTIYLLCLYTNRAGTSQESLSPVSRNLIWFLAVPVKLSVRKSRLMWQCFLVNSINIHEHIMPFLPSIIWI